MPNGKSKEREVRRAIEDRGFFVWDANVLFRENCPNIDLVVFGKSAVTYVQVKSSSKASGKNCVLIDGSPWTEEQLYEGAPIFNKHRGRFQAGLVVLVDTLATGEIAFYIVRPEVLEPIAVEIGRAFLEKPKRNGERRKMFRKEIPRGRLIPWQNAWDQLGEPENSPATNSI
jgi:hypothetical protein